MHFLKVIFSPSCPLSKKYRVYGQTLTINFFQGSSFSCSIGNDNIPSQRLFTKLVDGVTQGTTITDIIAG